MRFLANILAKAGLVVDGAVTLNNVSAASTDTDRFLVVESGVVKYRTGSQLLSDIAAVGGSGSTNYIPKFTGATTIGLSQLFDNGTNVGIGIATPSQLLTLAQTINHEPPAIGASGGIFGIFKNDGTAGGNYGMMMGVSSSGSVWQQVQRRDGVATVYNLLLQPNGGNVLIRTNTDSGDSLNVNGFIRSTSGLKVTDGTIDFRFSWASGNVGFIGNISNHAIGFYSNNAERMRLTAAGDVGIGTTSPNVKLEVSGLVRVTGTNGFSIGADSGQNRIQYSTSTFSRFALLSSGDSYIGLTAKELSIGATYGGTAPPSSGVIIEGNVGIGLTNPGAKLAVQETANSTTLDIANISTATAMPQRMLASFRGLYNSGANGHQLYLTSGTTDTSAWDMNFTKTWGGFISFGVSADGTTVTRQLTVATDRVGVGTTAPVASAKLDVTSTTQGFLPPRMTATQRAAISSPAVGLVVYQTDSTEGLWIYTSANGWKALAIVT